MEGHLALPGAEWFPKQSGHSYCTVCKPWGRQQNSSSHLCHFDEFCHGHKFPFLKEFKVSGQSGVSPHTARCIVDLPFYLFIYWRGWVEGFLYPHLVVIIDLCQSTKWGLLLHSFNTHVPITLKRNPELISRRSLFPFPPSSWQSISSYSGHFI